MHLKIIEDVKYEQEFVSGQLLEIDSSEAEIGWVHPFVYDFSNIFSKKEKIFLNKFSNLGKRVYVTSGTSCLYLCSDIFLLFGNDEAGKEEPAEVVLHRILLEDKVFWAFSIYLKGKK